MQLREVRTYRGPFSIILFATFRVGPEKHEAALKRGHASPMTFTGRSLKGFVYVDKAGVKSTTALRAWIKLAVAFVDSLPAKHPRMKRLTWPDCQFFAGCWSGFLISERPI